MMEKLLDEILSFSNPFINKLESNDDKAMWVMIGCVILFICAISFLGFLVFWRLYSGQWWF